MTTLLTLVLTCFFIGNGYVFIRALQAISGTPLYIKILFGILFWISAISLFIVLALRHANLPEFLPRTLFKIGSTWMVIILYMSLILFALDVIKYFFAPNIKYIFWYAIAATTIILLYGYINYLNPRINRIDIAIDKPFKGESMTIVAVSDMHLGYGTGKERLKEFVRMINHEKPDLILIAGDLIDNSLLPLQNEHMEEELKELNAPMGVYMVPGNHEYISGIEESKQFISNCGITMLCDSIVELSNGIQLILRDDFFNRGRMPLEDLISGTDGSKPMIMVDHQPHGITRKNELGIDLQISGHTHNGQIWPGNIVTNMIYEQSNGYKKWSHSHVYVSSGISLWGPPFRIGTNSDMAVFKIHSTK